MQNKIPKEWIEKIGLKETVSSISGDVCINKEVNFTKKKSKIEDKEKTLTKSSRQLIIFHIFLCSKVVEIHEILNLINPIKKTSAKTIMRDIKCLQNAGIINVSFSRKENGYIHKDFNNRYKFSPSIISNNKAENRVFEKLNRLGTIMIGLKNHSELPYYDDNSKNQETCVSWFQKKFPDISYRTMLRDFKELSYIGYKISYDRYEQCYSIDFPYGIEDIQIRLEEIYQTDYLE